MADLITDFAETQGLFHEGQFGGRRQRSAVDAVACLIGEIEQAWGEGKLGACLFMDIMGAFDHVVRQKLIGASGAWEWTETSYAGWTPSYPTGGPYWLLTATLVMRPYKLRPAPGLTGITSPLCAVYPAAGGRHRGSGPRCTGDILCGRSRAYYSG